MKNFKALAAMLACLVSGSAFAAVETHFDITFQSEAETPRIFRVNLAPSGTIKQSMTDTLFVEVRAPQEATGEGRSELRLLAQQKDGSMKVLHIGGIATFRDEPVQASYGMCGGRVVYRSDIAPGARVCE